VLIQISASAAASAAAIAIAGAIITVHLFIITRMGNIVHLHLTT
jgi:hypothetical protein